MLLCVPSTPPVIIIIINQVTWGIGWWGVAICPAGVPGAAGLSRRSHHQSPDHGHAQITCCKGNEATPPSQGVGWDAKSSQMTLEIPEIDP